MTATTSLRSSYLLGLDPGQAQDYSAFAVVERAYVPNGPAYNAGYYHRQKKVFAARQPVRLEYRVVHLERAELGTPYTQIAQRVLELVKALPTKEPAVVVDQGGVGRAVCDLIWQTLRDGLAGTDIQVTPAAVTMHGGAAIAKGNGGLRAPKRDVVSAPLVLMQRGALKVAEALPLRDVLLQEMKNFKVRIDPQTAHDSYTHWREGDHDDLLFSVAFPCWAGETYMTKLEVIDQPNFVVQDAPSILYGRS